MSKSLTWGYEHPELKKENALMFFTWDLSRAIEETFRDNPEEDIDLTLYKTQQAVDHLIRTYQDIKINPECFDGQFIKLSFEQNNDSPIPLLALKTSPELENRIIAMQQRVQTEEN